MTNKQQMLQEQDFIIKELFPVFGMLPHQRAKDAALNNARREIIACVLSDSKAGTLKPKYTIGQTVARLSWEYAKPKAILHISYNWKATAEELKGLKRSKEFYFTGGDFKRHIEIVEYRQAFSFTEAEQGTIERYIQQYDILAPQIEADIIAGTVAKWYTLGSLRAKITFWTEAGIVADMAKSPTTKGILSIDYKLTDNVA